MLLQSHHPIQSPPSPPAPTAPNEYSNPRHACNETDPRHDYHRPLSAVSHGHTRFTVACEEVTFSALSSSRLSAYLLRSIQQL